MHPYPQGQGPLDTDREFRAQCVADGPALAIVGAFQGAAGADMPPDDLQVFVRALEIKRERQVEAWLR